MTRGPQSYLGKPKVTSLIQEFKGWALRGKSYLKIKTLIDAEYFIKKITMTAGVAIVAWLSNFVVSSIITAHFSTVSWRGRSSENKFIFCVQSSSGVLMHTRVTGSMKAFWRTKHDLVDTVAGHCRQRWKVLDLYAKLLAHIPSLPFVLFEEVVRKGNTCIALWQSKC